MKKKKKKKNTKKPRERANHMSVQNKEHAGTVLYFFPSGDDSCCLKCIIICSMYDSCNL